MSYYASPRWTGEVLDCSMPMTFDTYNKCSYNCLYCFAFFQKKKTVDKTGSVSGDHNKSNYTDLEWVNTERVKRLFTFEQKNNQFENYIRARKVMQWGGMADQFDEHERREGKTLELLRFFAEQDYPLCFSTKGVWWLDDPRYTELFKGRKNWTCKFSIINLDPVAAKRMEKGVPSPQDRIEAIRKYTALGAGEAILRLRPFIIGHTNKDNQHLELMRQAREAGATAVSTEFFCLETRADEKLMARYAAMSEVIGFDIFDFYRKNSTGAGYRRLNYKLKAPYIKEMEAFAKKVGLRFYVSDAHHKERSATGSCCGLSEEHNYSRGQFTHALILAKKNGVVHFSDISKEVNELLGGFEWGRAEGYNTGTCEARAGRYSMTMAEYVRNAWNTPNGAHSPYKYFGGILHPIGVDENGDVIYEYRGEK